MSVSAQQVKELRDRSGAYPFELAYRLIQMFSVKNDTVVDPFLGTGTTSVAAMASQRNSIGYEIDSNFIPTISQAILKSVDSSNLNLSERLTRHMDFVSERQKSKGNLKYVNEFHGFPVMTRQETKAEFCFIRSANQVSEDTLVASYQKEDEMHIPGSQVQMSI